ncbi:MAG TPA: hypothetical protein VJ020_00530 [Anaerolineales bacterium]|nr:hypothetical protein [Anaerolineales bacterium]
MTLLSRLTLLSVVLITLSILAAFFRRLGPGEVGLIAAVFVLAFGVEGVRHIGRRIIKAYRGDTQSTNGKRHTPR